jgi:hypothetical protein
MLQRQYSSTKPTVLVQDLSGDKAQWHLLTIPGGRRVTEEKEDERGREERGTLSCVYERETVKRGKAHKDRQTDTEM